MRLRIILCLAAFALLVPGVPVTGTCHVSPDGCAAGSQYDTVVFEGDFGIVRGDFVNHANVPAGHAKPSPSDATAAVQRIYFALAPNGNFAESFSIVVTMKDPVYTVGAVGNQIKWITPRTVTLDSRDAKSYDQSVKFYFGRDVHLEKVNFPFTLDVTDSAGRKSSMAGTFHVIVTPTGASGEDEETGPNWMLWGLVAIIALIVVVNVALAIRRRRREP